MQHFRVQIGLLYTNHYIDYYEYIVNISGLFAEYVGNRITILCSIFVFKSDVLYTNHYIDYYEYIIVIIFKLYCPLLTFRK